MNYDLFNKKYLKIYIMGSTGTGKSTLSRFLSKKYNIKYYELDKVVYDDLDNHRKRSNEEINKLFNNIITKRSWIIEDVGRDKFILGRDKADYIFYIKLSKVEVFKRINIRWLKQRLGKEEYNYPPTVNQLIDINKITWNYFKKEKSKIDLLDKYSDKVIFINKKELNKLESSCLNE